MTDTPPPIALPSLEPVADVAVDVGAPIVVGETSAGLRRVVPILGGVATGRIAGRILPGGADFQILKRDDVTELEARYVIETAGGLVYVVNNGVRSGPKHVMDALARGEKVDPALVYFRAIPRFETAAPDLLWLTRKIFVCSGVRLPDKVVLRFYELQ
ncbi:MAG: DUF3237 domain-containing protein [Hyphomicrobiales bacterium]|nr:DUF3237 domain-containing protein [Hyphomicrobiales bacterium]